MTTARATSPADLYADLLPCFSGRSRRCLAGVWYTLDKAGNRWALTVESYGQNLTERAARELAADVAPKGAQWAGEVNGARWIATWTE